MEENKCPMHMNTDDGGCRYNPPIEGHRYRNEILADTRDWIADKGIEFADIVVNSLLKNFEELYINTDQHVLRSRHVAQLFIDFAEIPLKSSELTFIKNFIRGYGNLPSEKVNVKYIGIIGEMGLMQSVPTFCQKILLELFNKVGLKPEFNEQSEEKMKRLMNSEEIIYLPWSDLKDIVEKFTLEKNFSNNGVKCLGYGLTKRILYSFLSSFILRKNFEYQNIITPSWKIEDMQAEYERIISLYSN